jgi:hypothetical protein
MNPNDLRRNWQTLAHHAIYGACVWAMLTTSWTANAQSPPDLGRPSVSADTAPHDAAPPAKNPEDARLYGFLFPGGGQYYLDENKHGAAITAKTIALLGIGSLALLINNCSFTFSDQGQCTPHRQVGQVVIGSLLIAAGTWVWARAAVEAGRAAPISGDIRNLSLLSKRRIPPATLPPPR